MKHWMTWAGCVVVAGAIGWSWPAPSNEGREGAGCAATTTLELPPTEPFLTEIQYRWPSGDLLLCLPSGMAYDFAAVPPEVVKQLLDVEDKEVFFRRVLLASYVAQLDEAEALWLASGEEEWR